MIEGALLMLAWLLLGLVAVRLLRPDLYEETWTGLFNLFLWPIGLVARPFHLYRKWKREQQRQAHITEQVKAGKYTAEDARDRLKWKGPNT